MVDVDAVDILCSPCSLHCVSRKNAVELLVDSLTEVNECTGREFAILNHLQSLLNSRLQCRLNLNLSCKCGLLAEDACSSLIETIVGTAVTEVEELVALLESRKLNCRFLITAVHKRKCSTGEVNVARVDSNIYCTGVAFSLLAEEVALIERDLLEVCTLTEDIHIGRSEPKLIVVLSC